MIAADVLTLLSVSCIGRILREEKKRFSLGILIERTTANKEMLQNMQCFDVILNSTRQFNVFFNLLRHYRIFSLFHRLYWITSTSMFYIQQNHINKITLHVIINFTKNHIFLYKGILIRFNAFYDIHLHNVVVYVIQISTKIRL